MNLTRLIAIGLVVFLAAGCARDTLPDPEAESGSMVDSMDSMSDSNTNSMDDMGLGDGEPLPEFDELTMVIYFDFDQSTLRTEYADLLQRHASNLSADRRAQIRLEGHADERGSREYNIGLGERRSQAVRSLLLIQGAAADQIATVSFGEERPAAFGSDEESYELNRRVEIKYIN